MVRYVIAANQRAARGPPPLAVVVVFGGQGHAVQGADRVVPSHHLIRPAGLGERALGVQGDERVDGGLRRLGALEAGAGDLNRGEALGPDSVSRLHKVHPAEVHGALSRAIVKSW